jgi:two-component system, LuxR family, sensor kinase FixL
MSELGEAIAERGRLDGRHEIDPYIKTAIQTIFAGSAYVLAYMVLDWMGFVESDQLAGYSWNPNSGASFAAVLIFGRRILPFLFLAPILGDAVAGQFSLPLPYELASAGLIGGIYGATALFFLDARSSFDRTFQSMSSIILLVIATAVSAFLVAATHIGLIIVAGLLTTADFAVTTLSYWVGEVIGIVVVTPVALLLWTKRYVVWRSGETPLQLAGIVAALVVANIYWTAEHLSFFYILFVPIVWMAVRTGIEGVCLGLLVTQLCFIICFHALPNEISEMPKMQGLMLVLAFTGLFAGGLVT